MEDDIAISVKNVSKTFKLPHEKNTSIKSAFVNFYKRDKGYEEQEALKDISFDIKKGEFFGVVGRNGSGKSTLLKILAGIYSPNTGSVQVNGKLIPFIELGVGFSPELSGRDNVFLNGSLLGFSRKEMKEMYDDIVKFAEIERFMDQKLKNYSSGMQVRLAFSIAIRAKSEILLIDEVLAVGDAAFQTKCFDYFYELKKTDTTVIFVSHDRGSLERFCERGILIEEGKMIESGTIQEVLRSYSDIVFKELDQASEAQTEAEGEARPINKQGKVEYAHIDKVSTYDEKGNLKKNFQFGEKISLEFTVNIKRKIENPIIGVTVWCKNVDKAVYANNTLIDGIKDTGVFLAGEKIILKLSLPKLLNDGEYYIEPAIANESASTFYDQKIKAATFFISGSSNPHSIISGTDKLKLEVLKKGDATKQS